MTIQGRLQALPVTMVGTLEVVVLCSIRRHQILVRGDSTDGLQGTPFPLTPTNLEELSFMTLGSVVYLRSIMLGWARQAVIK